MIGFFRRPVPGFVLHLSLWVAFVFVARQVFGERMPTVGLVAAGGVVLGVHLSQLLLGRTTTETVRRLLLVVAWFAADLLPLLLPVLVVVAFMSRGVAWPLQAAVGVSTVAAVWLIGRAEAPSAWPILRELVRSIATSIWNRRREGTLPVALAVVVSGLAYGGLSLAARPVHALESAKHTGGWVGVITVLALGFWLGALALRLFASATTVARVVVAGFFALFLVRSAAFAGLVRGYSTWRRIGSNGVWIAVAVALPIAAGMSEAVWAHFRHTTLHPFFRFRVQAAAFALGFATAVGSALLLALALLVGLAQTAQGRDRPHDAFGPLQPARIVSNTAADDPEPLAKRFAPVLELSKNEAYPLEAVDPFLGSVVLTARAGKPVLDEHPRADTIGATCGPTRMCLLTCPEETACISERKPPADGRVPMRRVYAHLVRADKPGEPLDGPSPWMDDPPSSRPSAVIEYWLFYPYDNWEALTLAGILRQQHEGDWEVVLVGLSHDRPLFVAYSEHCAGSWVDWDDALVEAVHLDGTKIVLARRARDEKLTHPLVAVALGSHANYRDGRQRRPPDWAGCKGKISSDMFFAVSYASNIRDRTGEGGSWKVVADPKVVEATTPPMNIRGYWGRSDETRLVNNRRDLKPLALEDHGPSTPPMKDLWAQPLQVVFCGDHWLGRGWSGKKKACASDP